MDSSYSKTPSGSDNKHTQTEVTEDGVGKEMQQQHSSGCNLDPDVIDRGNLDPSVIDRGNLDPSVIDRGNLDHDDIDPPLQESVQGDQNNISNVNLIENETSSKSEPMVCAREASLVSSKRNTSSPSSAPVTATSSLSQKQTKFLNGEPKRRSTQSFTLAALCGDKLRELIYISKFSDSSVTKLTGGKIPQLGKICHDRIKSAINNPEKYVARMIRRDPGLSRRFRDKLAQFSFGESSNLRAMCGKRFLGYILNLDTHPPSIHVQGQIQQVYTALIGPHPPDFRVHPNQVNDIPWGEFHDCQKRLATYLLYPPNSAQRPVILAMSGFVYIGQPHSDSVICYYCNRIKSDWLPGDCVSLQHRPDCIQFNQPL